MKCITPECTNNEYWGKYCIVCYKKEFEKNRHNISQMLSDFEKVPE